MAFVYLEWRRARQLRRGRLSGPQRRVWESQRSFGGVQAVRQWAEVLKKLRDWLATPSGCKKLSRLLRAAKTPEYQVSA